MSRTYKKYKRCNKKTDMAFRVMNNSYSKHVSDNFYKKFSEEIHHFKHKPYGLVNFLDKRINDGIDIYDNHHRFWVIPFLKINKRKIRQIDKKIQKNLLEKFWMYKENNSFTNIIIDYDE
jgi:hypothetical protein